MKVLHLLSYHAAMTPSVLSFYEKYFDPEKHQFVLLNAPTSFDVGKWDLSVKTITKRRNHLSDNICFIKRMLSADLVAAHSFGILDSFAQILIMIFYPSVHRKLCWIEFGGDLLVFGDETERRSLRHNVFLWIYKKFCMRVPFVVCIFPPDLTFLTENILYTGVAYYAPYVGVSTSLCNRSVETVSSEGSSQTKPRVLSVLVGHRYSRGFNYERILRLVSRFASEDIKIIIPLSGGSDAEKKKIMDIGSFYFKSKVEYLLEPVPFDEYDNFLACVDIAIFDIRRYEQVALGTIRRLLTGSHKIFFPEKSSMTEFFQGLGVEVGYIENIATCSFDEFSKATDASRCLPFYRDVRDLDKQSRVWADIFSNIEKHIKGRAMNHDTKEARDTTC